MAYATALFEPPRLTGPTIGSSLTHIPARPKFRRSGALIPIEGGRWLVSLGGVHGDDPPNDLEGYLAFAATFRTPNVPRCDPERQASRAKSPASTCPAARAGISRRSNASPAGSFQSAIRSAASIPIYGQGMTVAAQEATTLAGLLEARRASADPLADLASCLLRRGERDGRNALGDCPGRLRLPRDARRTTAGLREDPAFPAWPLPPDVR